MRFIQQLRTKYNLILEHAIRLCTLTAISFTVTACYGCPPEAYEYDPNWQQEQDSLEQQMEQHYQSIAQSDIEEPIEEQKLE